MSEREDTQTPRPGPPRAPSPRGAERRRPPTSREELAAMPTLAEAAAGEPAPSASHPDDEGRPRSIGPFRVVRELGRGGMGVVYEAEQDTPRRTVALKVMRPSLMSEQARARFERESGVLAMLRHPGIAPVYQAGRAPIDGAGEHVSYFAMELVEGLPLTAWADDKQLDTRARLRLLARVARAVHHAHTKGVIHRDLKPANVLVDADGRPRVLDFGIARLVEADAPNTLSETGQMIGTLAYMSPEQVNGATADLDTRSDVFALGVIGYELLSGRLPHTVEGRSIVESVRTIAEGEIKPLSSIDVRLRGDVATIIGTALEKDRDRRYQSADELARDIERYLADQPILARPPSLGYTLSKLARRHKPLVAAGVLAVLSVVGGAGIAGWQAVSATRARRVAEVEGAVSAQVSDFLERMLESANPDRAQGEELTVREVVADAAGRIDTAELAEPVEARIRYTLGKTASLLGDYEQAETLLRRSIDLFERVEGPDDRETISARRQLGYTLAEAGRPDEAEAIARDALDRLQRRHGPADADAIAARSEIARALLDVGRVDEATAMFEAALADAEAALGDEHEVTLTIRHNLASTLRTLGRLDESVAMNREVLAVRQRTLGERHPDTITTMNNIASALVRLGDAERGEAMLRDVLRLRREVLGDAHRATATAMLNLAGVLLPQGRLDEGEPLIREALAVCRDRLGREHPITLSSMNQLAYLLEDRGRLAEAEPLYRETIDILETTAGRDNPEMFAPVNNLASLLVRDGRPGEAAPIFEDLIERATRLAGPEHFMTGIFRSNYGECLAELGRPDAAAAEQTAAIGILEAALGADHPRVAKARARLEAAREQPATP